MKTDLRSVAVECFFDLGVTLVYATLAGLVIVAVAASDDGPSSLMMSLLYASLLPAGIALLIAVEVLLRVAADRRRDRRHHGSCLHG